MKIFGTKSAEKAAEVEPDYEALAVDAERIVSADMPALLLAFIDDHDRDTAGFSFDCSVWGDFLRLSVARGKPKVEYEWAKDETNFSTALSLRNIDSVRLIEGHAPNNEGKVHYYFDWQTKIVKGQLPQVPYRRSLFYMPPPPQQQQNVGMMMSSQQDRVRLITKCPQAAGDDVVLFEKMGAKLFVPFGKGAEVYERVLTCTVRPSHESGG